MNLNRFFYGKDWEYKSVFEKEKYFKRRYWIFFSFTILFMFLSSLGSYNLIENNKLLQDEIVSKNYYKNAYFEELNEEIIVNKSSVFDRISFDGLNEEQQVEILSVMYSLNEKYKPFFNSMIFTNNRTRINEFCNDKNNHTIGCNENSGEQIMIYYSGDTEKNNLELKEIICHEILHTTIVEHNKETHEIVYHLGNLEVCFEN